MGVLDAARKSYQLARWVAVLARLQALLRPRVVAAVMASCRAFHALAGTHVRLLWWLTHCHALPKRQTMLPSIGCL